MDKTENQQKVESWLKDISAALGVELAPDAEGICSFLIGEDVIITIEVSRDFPIVNLYSPLMPLPANDVNAAASVMARALELNAFQALTRGGAIAIPPGGGPLIFCYNIATDNIDSEIFSKILGGFFETISEVKTLLTQTAAIEKPVIQAKKGNITMIKV